MGIPMSGTMVKALIDYEIEKSNIIRESIGEMLANVYEAGKPAIRKALLDSMAYGREMDVSKLAKDMFFLAAQKERMMSNGDLGTIKRSLNGADLFVDDAENAAKKAGDKQGAERIKKLSDHVKEVKESFDKT